MTGGLLAPCSDHFSVLKSRPELMITVTPLSGGTNGSPTYLTSLLHRPDRGGDVNFVNLLIEAIRRFAACSFAGLRKRVDRHVPVWACQYHGGSVAAVEPSTKWALPSIREVR